MGDDVTFFWVYCPNASDSLVEKMGLFNVT